MKTYRTTCRTIRVPQELARLTALRDAAVSRGSWNPSETERAESKALREAKEAFRLFNDTWHRVWLASDAATRAIIETTIAEIESTFATIRIANH
jgi:hypothetical protein